MSKLLTDLMAAERRRRQLDISRIPGDAPANAGDPALARVAAEVMVATAGHEEAAAAARAATRSATTRSETAMAPTSSRGDSLPAWRRLFAATALALIAGLGIGIWLGKPPAVSAHPWSADQDRLRLRLDDRLMNPPPDHNRSTPGDLPQ